MKTTNKITKPNNTFALFKSLFLGKLKLNPLWDKKMYRLKFALRAIFLSPKTFSWLKHLAYYPQLDYYLSRQTNLPCKLQRPYLSSCFNSKMALNALIYHYDFFAQRADLITQKFYSEKGFLLAEFLGKNESTFRINVRSEDKYAREGEVSMTLYDQNNIDLSIITFSIINYNNQPTLFIAGLQGSNAHNARTIIQKATKSCYGLFPKRIMIEAILAFAKFFKLNQIVAVGNKTHIYNNWRYRSRFKKLHSDYDDFWKTIDAKKNNQGLFEFPNAIARKAIEDIASKKRSEYRNRYLLLNNLSREIIKQLSTLI